MVCDENNTTGVFCDIECFITEHTIVKGLKKELVLLRSSHFKTFKGIKIYTFLSNAQYYETLLFCVMNDYKDNLKANTEN